MNKCNDTVDRKMRENIGFYSQFYLAITILMSKCKYIVCGSGNCSLFIVLYRGNSSNVIQFRNNVWIEHMIPRILFKIPSRSRPQKLLDCLSKVKSLADDIDSIRIIMTLDTDDHSMTPEYEKQLSEYGEIRYHNCTSKIDAVNRDLEGDEEIIVLGSDDMIAEIQGWDTIIKEKMLKEFPNLDGALFFNDGYRADLNTMTIMSRKLYNEYGYLYHPSYKSLYCDEEWTLIGKATKKLIYDPRVIFRHVHFANVNTIKKDELYTINDTYWTRDQTLFLIRKKQGFPRENPFFYCLEKVVAEADTNLDPSYRLKTISQPQKVFISIDQIDTYKPDNKIETLYINSKQKQFTNKVRLSNI
jgi:hypothetical protein